MGIDLKNKKNLLILSISIILLIVMGWFFLGRNKDLPSDSLLEISSDPIENIIGRELLTSLEKMKQVKLDTSILGGEVYNSLIDFTVDIPKQPVGRRDPFAPIGY